MDEDFASQCLLTDDIWDKFQFSNVDLVPLDIDFDTFEPFGDYAAISNTSEIRNHDCMWAGHCGSKEHSLDDLKGACGIRIFKPTPMPMPIVVPAPLPAKTAHTIAPGRSLLLKTQPQVAPIVVPPLPPPQPPPTTMTTINPMVSYESPPNSDDDEDNKSSVLRYLQDAISECDIDEKDLYDYFEDNKADPLLGDEMEEEEEEEEEDDDDDIDEEEEDEDNKEAVQAEIAAQYQLMMAKDSEKALSQLVNDHCYFKEQNSSSMRNLGIDTPSDSEEEIDVVSTDDKRGGGALPTNPTNHDRQHLQQTMASAMHRNGGIRTLLPRKPAADATLPRGVKRNRRHRRMPPLRFPKSPYTKRTSHSTYHHHQHQFISSDDSDEPAEKRIEHNNMERQRRIDLRNAFEELRVLVPDVVKRDRAPKVIILREAALYCHQLAGVSRAMERQVDEMQRNQQQLRARLSQLRLSLAPKHC